MGDFEYQVLHDNYELVEPVYKDKDTGIYLANRISDGHRVIIKQSLDTEDNVSGMSNSGNEYDILKNLHHDGIPKVCEVFYSSGAFALVEEYFEGENLREYIFKGSIQFNKALHIAIQLADILHYLHGEGVVHKNINPGNVIIQKNGSVKLIDFTISSRLNSSHDEMLNIDQIEGSLSYISPEQTGRTAFLVDHAADFYSLGILLYELLAGKPPFDSTDPLEVIHFHLSRNATPLRSFLPELPAGLDKVVAKMLQKNPDDRYQSAAGLKADLEMVLEHHRTNLPLTGFKAGSKDIFRYYKPNQKLYGRDDEIAMVLNQFRDLNQSKSKLVLVSGYAGVGKSALIKHAKYPIIQSHGKFISGKFDQFKKDIPYYAFIEAFQEFIRQLLTEPEDKITYWRQRIVSVLGSNAGLITEVIPQLSMIIQKQAPVAKLQPAEQEARFNKVLLDFIYIFNSADNPLVIFLDDLQWADLSSLNLVRRIIQDPRPESILILGAYRDNEVDKGHPLMITISQIGQSSDQIKSLKLKTLDVETTIQISADSFTMSQVQANSLGKKVFTKTKGNPFFIHNFLKALYDKKIIKTDIKEEWIWDPDEIDDLGYTDNVIDLMTRRLTDLPRETQEILKIAAVLGNTFYLADLNTIVEKSVLKICSDIEPALKQGYLVSNDKNFRALTLNAINKDFDADKFVVQNSTSFSFCHDKVQQAAYGLITPSENAALHLKIGRLLLKNRSGSKLSEGIFELLNLFAQGLHLIESEDEKKRISELCLIAGRKAKDSISYGLAVRFLGMGKSLFTPDYWENDYNLTYNTLLELGECEYLNDNPAKAEEYFQDILGHSTIRFDKLKVHYLHSSLYLKMGNTAKSLELGLEAMKLYHIRFPKDKRLLRILTLIKLSKYLFLFSTKYRNPESLLAIEDCKDEENIAINKFLIDLATSAYQQDQNLMMLVIFEIIKSYLKHGFTDASGFGFSGFSTVVLSSLKLQKRGFELWNLTIKHHEKTHSPLIKWRLKYTVSCFHDPWRIPFRAGYDDILESIKACLINGDQIFTGYTVALYLRMRITAGENLTKIIDSSEDHFSMIKTGKGGLDFFHPFYQIAKALNNRTFRGSWDDDTFDGEETLRRLEGEGNHTKLAIYHVAKTALLFYLGRYEEAVYESHRTLKYKDNMLGDVIEVWHAFYTCLSISANFEQFDSISRTRNLRVFKSHLKDIKLWVNGCPENYDPYYYLLKAELYTIEKKCDKAISWYEKAIQSATLNKITYIAAIANENAARCCEDMQLSRRISYYVNGAWEAYDEWGALIKCQQLESKYPHILIKGAIPDLNLVNNTGIETTVSSKTALDLASLLKASQSIARQVKYKDLLKTLMHILIESAGAEKGCFLLSKEGMLYLEAVGRSGQKGIEILPSIRLSESDLAPKSFVYYCWRSEESVVVDDAQSEPQYSNDPYVIAHNTLSMMCLPISTLGQLKGMVYLENNLIQGVFDEKRIELLQMLSGQIGIAIENSLLYENLEEKVAERTRVIENTLTVLKETQNQLIQSEKMASLGELTAGIAHEIQNPLNFVINFSEVSTELLDEMRQAMANGDTEDATAIMNDVIQNLEKINHHGKRAGDIVKGMLQHSRTSTGQKELTDINVLADECLRLSYHGLRAKDKSFNAKFESDFDHSIPKINVVPQDLGRVILNLINNAFYAVSEKSKQDIGVYVPTVKVSTKEEDNKLTIAVRDNGNGIPKKVQDKIFQPFFTTKPTGQGTGLGLSLAYDIVKAQGGEIKVESKEGEGSEFIISLPVV